MLNRIIEVSEENRYVSLSRGFMVIKDESKILGQIPLDDISTLLLTSHGITLSKNVLNALAERNCITVLCGKNYVPQSMVLPVANHCFFTKNVKMQIDCSVPFKKRIWQQIVVQKIKNQSIALKSCGKDGGILDEIASAVKSGDQTNREGHAAKTYWRILFGKEFVRDRYAPGINALLNYGYAVMRAAMARAICSAGLIAALGVNHRNNLNQFCLADDFFEIYRPVVDVMVFGLNENGMNCVTPETKKILTNLLWTNVHTKSGNSPAFQSMQYLVNSYVQAMEEKNPVIDLPVWDGTTVNG